MQVSRGVPALASHPAVLTIGNFDGLHLGHQRLLGLLRQKAHALGLPATVMTFEPHPREFFSPESAPARLASLREKLIGLAEAGIDHAVVVRFDAHFAALSASDFVEQVLVRGLATRHLFIGDDFRFGARRQGDFSMLCEAGDRHRFQVEAMPTVAVADERVSSSAVRSALAAGDLAHAGRLLGRPYSIAGRVVRGDRIGRTLGFPTANVQLRHRRVALTGIFTVSVEGLAARALPGVASIGLRPTVSDAGRTTLEVHVFDYDADCYGAHLRVNFLDKQRDEEKYPNLDLLKAQIARDAARARAWFASKPL
ncbi:MAG: bifunctional riboflavin kinase/FAD synthetase [Zoogloeaceae bacterium]|nr:bifunctional riboflavin kinase/FAD synthetase [Rhodocyclaceae bacterium]MCP5237445.1 bifunctional riboflavin kinase/FAD synthetase [Zoogloeaceae bacterium]